MKKVSDQFAKKAGTKQLNEPQIYKPVVANIIYSKLTSMMIQRQINSMLALSTVVHGALAGMGHRPVGQLKRGI